MSTATIADAETLDAAAQFVLTQSPFFGYNNSGSPWHSDAGTLLTLICQDGGVSPVSLFISSGEAIDQLQMTVITSDRQTIKLTKYGNGGGGSGHTLNATQIASIVNVQLWGATQWDPPRLGMITINFSSGQPQTFGKQQGQYLGAFTVPSGTVLLGFTGDSGSMVDGIALLAGSATA